MHTGVIIPDGVREEFQQLRLKRKYRYIIYKLTDDKTGVEIDKLGARDETFDQFKESMPKDNARWAIFDLEFMSSDGRKVSKLCFILYGPDSNTDSAEKFSIAANKDALKSKVSEVNRDFQVNRWDDLDAEAFQKSFGI